MRERECNSENARRFAITFAIQVRSSEFTAFINSQFAFLLLTLLKPSVVIMATIVVAVSDNQQLYAECTVTQVSTNPRDQEGK